MRKPRDTSNEHAKWLLSFPWGRRETIKHWLNNLKDRSERAAMLREMEFNDPKIPRNSAVSGQYCDAQIRELVLSAKHRDGYHNEDDPDENVSLVGISLYERDEAGVKNNKK